MNDQGNGQAQETDREYAVADLTEMTAMVDGVTAALEKFVFGWSGPAFLTSPAAAAKVLIEGLQSFRTFTMSNQDLGGTGTDYDQQLRKAAVLVATRLFEYALGGECEEIQVQDPLTGKTETIVKNKTAQADGSTETSAVESNETAQRPRYSCDRGRLETKPEGPAFD